MKKTLYSKQDNDEINTSIQEQISTPSEEDNTPRREDNVPSEEVSKTLLSLNTLNDIKTMFSSNTVTRTYFTTSKGRVSFNLSGTVLEPSKLVLIQPKSVKREYVKQLENTLFHSSEKELMSSLIPLVFLTNSISEGRYPIQVKYSKFNRLTPNLVKGLNEFYSANMGILLSMKETFLGLDEKLDKTTEENDSK